MILVVDDSKAICVVLKDFLEAEGYTVSLSLSAEEAILFIDQQNPDLVIMDVQMKGMGGLEALTAIKKKDAKIPVIIMTGYGTTQTAIEAMKNGAYDYITKPFKNEEFKVLVHNALESGKLMRERVSYEPNECETGVYSCIIGKSPAMLDVYKTIGKVADTTATVLIRGESGTGKELVARALYQHSSRKDKPFLAVNCAAIPESLLEAELFGHEKGAFTGAVNKRVGKFQQCDGGTILLDEIGDMSLATQTKILRVLQEHTLEPVGSNQTVTVDVRVLASTNKDLSKAIENKEFREDLYYRLKVIMLNLPALRQRIEDVPLLVEYFLNKFNRELNKQIQGISEEALRCMREYAWPGNVRELENAMQTAVIMAKKEILIPDDFPVFHASEGMLAGSTAQPVGYYQKVVQGMLSSLLKDPKVLEKGDLYKSVGGEVEKTLIEMVLNQVEGNQLRAAKILGISRNTLRSRMKEFGLLVSN